MRKIRLHLGDNWTKSGNTYARGAAFLGKKFLSTRELAAVVDNTPPDGARRLLCDLNGFFAFIRIDGSEIFGAADRVRTIPFFYASSDKQFQISDDAYRIAGEIGDRETNHLGRMEFLLSGYVTSEDTLCPRVKQVQAGELLRAIKTPEDGFKVVTEKYYRYLHGQYFTGAEDVLLWKQEEMLTSVFNRLVRYADGRPIVVPLSGGYDSRLIVLMLKKLGYDDVITFSYGKPNNEEARISRRVAANLGVRWEFVPYSNEKWHEWFRSTEMRDYQSKADNLSTLAYIQDWPAVRELKKEGKIPEDGVFVPGLSADLPTGGFSLKFPELYKEGKCNEARLFRALIHYQYCLWDWSQQSDILEPVFIKRVLKSLGDMEQYPEPAGVLEAWILNEKVAKFVNNSVRVYEYRGFDWWLPFWDHEFMDFWSKVPLKFRLKQNLYLNYIKSLYTRLSPISEDEALKRDGCGKSRALFKKLLKVSPGRALLRNIHTRANLRKRVRDDPLRMYGLVPGEYLDFYGARSRSINSFLTLNRIGYIDLSGEEKPDKCVPWAKIVSNLITRL